MAEYASTHSTAAAATMTMTRAVLRGSDARVFMGSVIMPAP